MVDIPLQAFVISTVYLTGGFLYILVSVAAWLMLKNQGAFAPTVWCMGGGVLGVGCILLGLRGMVAPWLSFLVGNSCLVLGNLLHIYALRREVEKPLSMWVLVGLYLLDMLPFLFFLFVVEIPLLRFSWNMACLAGLVGWTAWLGKAISDKEQNKSATWLASVYALLMLVIVVRGALAFTGVANSDALSNTASSLLVIVGVLVTAVLGNVAVIGLYLERSNKKNVAFAVDQERQWTLSVLSEKVAHQDRVRSLDEMSSSLAHELGQPITGLIFDSGMLKLRCQKLGVIDAHITTLMQSMNTHAMRAKDIIESIRRFSKPVDMQHQRLDVREVLDDANRILSFSAHKTQIHLEIQKPPQAVWVLGSAVLLSLLFLNLFRNAIQAKNGEGPVHVKVILSMANRLLTLHVEDDGPGFSEQGLGKAGSAYFTTKSEGMGIGLALCRTIAVQHLGDLSVSNRKDKPGAVVTLTLPLMAD